MMVKKLMRRVMGFCGIRAVHLGRYLLVMRVVGDVPEAGVEPDALERYMFECSLGEVLRRLDVNCVLDVGANKGQYGVMLRSLGYTGYIVSFEPTADAFKALQEVASRDPKWTVHQWALGAQPATAPMHVMRSTEFSSLLDPTPFTVQRFQAGAPVDHDEQVKVRRLDQILPAVIRHVRDPRLFLKIDTQGYDLEVVNGAGRAIERMRGLQSEIAVVPLYQRAPDMSESLAAYRARGFELSGLFPVVYDPDADRVLEYDCVMVRPAELARPPHGGRFTPPGGNGLLT